MQNNSSEAKDTFLLLLRRRIGIGIITLTALTVLCPSEGKASSAKKTEALSRYVQAGQAYKEGQYEKAIPLYQEILAMGFESGALYYNLGNSYFKQGTLGYAILYYERARRLMPRDSDLKANYRFAQSFLQGAPPSDLENWLFRIVRSSIDFWTVNELVWEIFYAFLFMGILHLMGLYAKWPLRMRQGLLGVLSLLLVFSSFCLFNKMALEKNQAVVVSPTESRFEPREEAIPHFLLAEGWMIRVLREEGSWLKIRNSDGKVGWIPEKKVERIY